MQPTFQEEETEPTSGERKRRNSESYKSNKFFFFFCPGSLLGSEAEDSREGFRTDVQETIKGKNIIREL